MDRFPVEFDPVGEPAFPPPKRLGMPALNSGDRHSTVCLTPPALLALLASNYGTRQSDKTWAFDLDPAPHPRPDGFDGLSIPWHGTVFVNPPYGARAIVPWLRKAQVELEAGHCLQVTFLLPSHTESRWFHDELYPRAQELIFICGHVRFLQADGTPYPRGNPFGNLVAVMNQDPPHTPHVGTLRLPCEAFA